MWQIAGRHYDTTVATSSVWAVAALPMSGVFSLLYPSALFLAASVWAFDLAERGQWPLCGVVASVATLARPNGAVIAVVLAVVAYTTAPTARRWSTTAIVSGPSATAIAVWVAVCALQTGNPLVFLTAKSAWHEQTLLALVRRVRDGGPVDSTVFHVAIGLLAAGALWRFWPQLARSWRVIAATTLLVPTATGLIGTGRYSNECFPLAIAAGSLLAALAHRTRRAVIAGSLLVSMAATATMAAHGLVP